MDPTNNLVTTPYPAGPQNPSDATPQALGMNIVGVASNSGTMNPESIHGRQVQLLPPGNKVQSVITPPDHDTVNLCTTLINQVIRYLSIVTADISDLPVVTGVFARAFHQPCMASGVQFSQAQVSAISGENRQLDIVVSPGQCENLVRLMGRFLVQEKKQDARISTFSGKEATQADMFQYRFHGEVFFTIRLLTLDAPADLEIQSHTYQPSEGKPVILKTSLVAGAAWLNQQFAGLVHMPDALNIIETEFQKLGISDEDAWFYCPEIQQWGYPQKQFYLQQIVLGPEFFPGYYLAQPVVDQPVAQPVFLPHQVVYPLSEISSQSAHCPGFLQVPIQVQPSVPMHPEASATTATIPPGSQEAAEDQTGDLVPSSSGVTPVAGHSAPVRSVLNHDIALIQHTRAIQDLGFSLIADILPSLEPSCVKNQNPKGEPEANGDSKSREKKGRRGVNAPERAKNARKKGSAKGLRARGSDRYGFAAAMQALTKGVNVVADEQRTRLEKLSIPDEVIKGLNNLISTEKSATLVRHPFRHSPFLGRAQCYYVKQPEEGFSYSYEGLAGSIEKMVHELCDTLKQGEGSVESQNEVRAIIAALMLKYLVYMPKETHQMSALLCKLTEMIEHDCRIIAQYDAGKGSPILKLLPQTFLVVLTSPELGTMTFGVNLQQRLVSTLATIMSASNHHGCYDISASIISSLQGLPLPDLNWHEANNLTTQIQETFGYLHQLMGFPGASWANRLSAARAVIDLSDGLHAFQKKGEEGGSMPWFSAASAKQDHLAKAVRSAEKMLDDDELVLKRECRELVRAKRKEQEDIRRKQVEARMKMQQKESHPVHPREQPEEQSEQKRYYLVTAPIRDTAVDVIKLELSPWEQELAVAVSLYKDGQLVDAEATRASALKACKDKIDQACVWADCGNALLEPYQELLARVVTVAAKVNSTKRQLDLIATHTPDDLVRKPDDARQWLKKHDYDIPKEASLLSLAINLPSQDEMNALLKALRSTVEMYEKAVELMNDCSVLQLRDTGDFILHIMESDLNSLFDQQADLLSIRKNVARVMTARTDIMKRLGFYGPHSGHKAAEAITYQKSVYTQMLELLSREAIKLEVNQADLTRWGNLMDRIGQLRIKSSEG